jgi:hypothetical protein
MVALAHLAVLDGAPPAASSPAATLRVPALFTRALAAPPPQPPALAQPTITPPAAVAKRPAKSARPTAAVTTVTARAKASTPPPPDSAAAEPEIPHTPPPEPEPPPTPAPPPATAVRVPGPAVLRYRVTGSARGLPYTAKAELRWQPGEDARYEAVWSAGLPLLGTRTQRSQGRITSTGLAPERYAEKWRSEQAAHFDLEGARIRFSANTPDAALQPGAQDRLSITLQLAALLAAAPEQYPPGSTITLQTAGVRAAEPWTWQVLPDETLTLGNQPLPTVKLLRQPREERDTGIELWLARTRHYLPARLRLTQANGDVADQQVQSIEQAEPPK